MTTPQWATCDCCWPQKPFIRKAVGWYHINGGPRDTIPPFWYLDLGGWPTGHYDTWEQALYAAGQYLIREQ